MDISSRALCFFNILSANAQHSVALNENMLTEYDFPVVYFIHMIHNYKVIQSIDSFIQKVFLFSDGYSYFHEYSSGIPALN